MNFKMLRTPEHHQIISRYDAHLCRHISRRDCVMKFMLRVHKKKSSIERGVQSVTYAHTHWKLPTSHTAAAAVSWMNSLRNFQKKYSKHSFQGLSRATSLSFFSAMNFLKKEISCNFSSMTSKMKLKVSLIVWQSNDHRHHSNQAQHYSTHSLIQWGSYHCANGKKSRWMNVIKVPRFILFFDIDCKMAFFFGEL